MPSVYQVLVKQLVKNVSAEDNSSEGVSLDHLIAAQQAAGQYVAVC